MTNPQTDLERPDLIITPADSSIKNSKPKITIRASAARGCRRRLWYSAYQPQGRAPFNAPTRRRLRGGQILEDLILDELKLDKHHITERSLKTSYLPFNADIHDDALLVLSGTPDALGPEQVFEVKARSSGAWTHWRSLGAHRSHPDTVFQVAAYMQLHARDNAVLACLNTETYQLETEPFAWSDVEDNFWSGIQHLAEAFPAFLDSSKPPARDFHASSYQCIGCSWVKTCRPAGTLNALEIPAVKQDEPALLEAAEELVNAKTAMDIHKMQGENSVAAYARARSVLGGHLEATGAKIGEWDVPGGRSLRISRSITRRTSIDQQKLALYLNPERRAEVLIVKESAMVRATIKKARK